jgi:N utilization substance protein A
MNEELLLAMEYLEQEKGIEKDKLIDAIKSALISAVRRVLNLEREGIEVEFDSKKGGFRVLCDGKEVDSAELGRIAAQTAKQVITQKLHEAEMETVYDEYKDRIGEIVSGTVNRVERGNVIVELDKAEAFLPKSEQPKQEAYRQGQKLKALVIEVKKQGRGPQVILSRTRVELVKKLFQLEVPEIQNGVVEIIAIAREPGERTKIAVNSKDKNVDSVGSCVGMKGIRVKSIVQELEGEKIDIIRYSSDSAELIKVALSPAEVSKVKLFPKEKKALVILDKTQLSLAIGKHGQNVRLASQLTGWDIDVRSPEDLEEKSPLRELEGIGPKLSRILIEAGYSNIESLAKASVDELSQVEGLGARTARRIVIEAKKYIKEKKCQG